MDDADADAEETAVGVAEAVRRLATANLQLLAMLEVVRDLAPDDEAHLRDAADATHALAAHIVPLRFAETIDPAGWARDTLKAVTAKAQYFDAPGTAASPLAAEALHRMREACEALHAAIEAHEAALDDAADP